MTTFTAQIVDTMNTSRCATIIVAGHTEREACRFASRLARVMGRSYRVADFYRTEAE